MCKISVFLLLKKNKVKYACSLTKAYQRLKQFYKSGAFSLLNFVFIVMFLVHKYKIDIIFICLHQSAFVSLSAEEHPALLLLSRDLWLCN